MRIRNGFVSNSSSSSFVINKCNLNSIVIIDNILVPYAGEKIRGYAHLIDVKDYKKNKKFIASIIKNMYEEQGCDATSKIDPLEKQSYSDQSFFRKILIFFYNRSIPIIMFFRKTYLQEAMKSHIFGTFDRNKVSHDVFLELEERYGKYFDWHDVG